MLTPEYPQWRYVLSDVETVYRFRCCACEAAVEQRWMGAALTLPDSERQAAAGKGHKDLAELL
jgi:hypothetical protein